jgi:hypothetical protein
MPRTTGSFDLAFGAPEARLRIAIRRPIYTFPRISAVFPRKSSRYEAPRWHRRRMPPASNLPADCTVNVGDTSLTMQRAQQI